MKTALVIRAALTAAETVLVKSRHPQTHLVQHSLGRPRPWRRRAALGRPPGPARRAAAVRDGRPSDSLVCMQEVVASQLRDVAASLGPAWASVGVWRDDGLAGGEFSPILYRPDTWTLVGNATYWLSETPEMAGSVGWDAAVPRIVTVGRFRHASTGLPLVYMCTHLDHVGRVARQEAASLLVRLASDFAAARGEPTPVFLGGDLNMTPDDPAFRTMVADGRFTNILDMTAVASMVTSTGFAERPYEQNTRVDHVFVWRADTRGMAVLTYGVLENRFDDGLWLSDNRAVVLDVEFAAHDKPYFNRT